MKPLSPLTFCGLSFVASLSLATAVTYTDPFTDGLKEGGADNSGIAWFDRSANSDLTVDASGGALTGNALNFNLGNATASGTSVINRGFVGVLGTTLTPAIGDSLTLSFDFQLRSTPTNLPPTTFTSSPGNSSQGLTFGFYSSVGSVATADSSSSTDNDRGFRGSIGSGTSTAADIFRETNSGAGGLGTTNTSAGPPPTTDSISVTNAGNTPVAVNDFLKHSALFTMTRTGADEYSLELRYDGTVVATGTSTVGAYTSFDEVMFSQGGGNNLSIDNVVVTFVPEPSAALLGALSALGILRRRR
jgi:hypothetical protein